MMQKTPCRARCLVDLPALRHNFETVKERLAPGCKIMSVVKADAYGHGDIRAAQILSDSDYFAVACLDEGIRLRENGVTKPILVLGYTAPEQAPLLARYDLSQCAFDGEYLQELQNCCEGKQLKIHLKIDTGMSRLGFYAHDDETADRAAEEVAASMAKAPSFEYEGIFTHFTTSDLPGISHTQEQFSVFLRVLDRLKEKGIEFPLRHCANSGAIFNYPETHLDMVRPGIVLYGYAPDPAMGNPGLKPVLKLEATVAQVHHLSPGDGVSYGRTYLADREIDVATVTIGYADGLHRALSNGAPVLINGCKTQILGRICMDQCIIDVTGIPAKPGDTVTLIGTDGAYCVTADDLAAASDTISYEILCNIGGRVPRIYQY